jgi:hypothetical protein
MTERGESSRDSRVAVPSTDAGAHSSHKKRRIDQEVTSTPNQQDPLQPQQSFLFVESTPGGRQRARSDQRTINAHIQQTAHRIRKSTTQKKSAAGSNISRSRRELQPRPPTRSPATNEDQERPSAEAVDGAATSTVFDVDRIGEDFEGRQLERLRHYSTYRAPEVRNATGLVQRARTDDDGESASVRSMLAQILQRLDAGHAGYSIQSSPDLSIRNTALDPFNISSVRITPQMNSVLRHCKLDVSVLVKTAQLTL